MLISGWVVAKTLILTGLRTASSCILLSGPTADSARSRCGRTQVWENFWTFCCCNPCYLHATLSFKRSNISTGSKAWLIFRHSAWMLNAVTMVTVRLLRNLLKLAVDSRYCAGGDACFSVHGQSVDRVIWLDDMQTWQDTRRVKEMLVHAGLPCFMSCPSTMKGNRWDLRRILNRHHAAFLLLLPVKNHTCSAETVSDTLSFSHMARGASQSLLLPSDSSSTILIELLRV